MPRKKLIRIRDELDDPCLDMTGPDFDTITTEETNRLVDLAKSGDRNAKERLVNANIRYFRHYVMATRKHSPKVYLDEMFQIVRCGILMASAKYVYPSNGKFSSYCFFYVRREMIKYFHELNIISFTLTKSKDPEIEEQKQIARNTTYINEKKYHVVDDYEERIEGLENSLKASRNALKFFEPLNETDRLVLFHYFGAYDHTIMNINEISYVTGKSKDWISRRKSIIIHGIRKQKSTRKRGPMSRLSVMFHKNNVRSAQ
jgi:DNA-directed RNA polymerase specialized sigma subunit